MMNLMLTDSFVEKLKIKLLKRCDLCCKHIRDCQCRLESDPDSVFELLEDNDFLKQLKADQSKRCNFCFNIIKFDCKCWSEKEVEEIFYTRDPFIIGMRVLKSGPWSFVRILLEFYQVKRNNNSPWSIGHYVVYEMDLETRNNLIDYLKNTPVEQD